jgi:hypothetical protein
VPAIEDDVWTKLEHDAQRLLWAEFADRYQFRVGVKPDVWPAIPEPTPSITWDLSSVFTSGDFANHSRGVAQLVLDLLTACTEWWESLVFHDWVHPSVLFWPHRIDSLDEVPRWQTGGLFPNGDYTILLARGDRFGVFGHPWEQSLCVFGAHALTTMDRLNRSTLTQVLREDGRPADRRSQHEQDPTCHPRASNPCHQRT